VLLHVALEASAAISPAAVHSTVRRLRAWVSSCACQTESGAFTAWVDLGTGTPAYEYPEITGYALTFFAGLPALAEEEREAGERAAVWLDERVRRGDLAARDGWDNDAVYLFDLAMMATGLMTFGRRVQDDRLVRSGRDLVGFLAGELGSGGFSAVSTRGPRSGRRGWSTQGLPHLAKLAQAFLLAGEPVAEEPIAALVDAVKVRQAADGRMPTDADGLTTMLHAHLYAAEGLWIWGSARGDQDALERARAAVEWAWARQLDRGGFPRSVSDTEPDGAAVEQSDVTAQAVRLAFVLGLSPDGVDRAIVRLVELSRGRGPAAGLLYQAEPGPLHLNTWSTLFGAQALAMAVPNAPLISWQELI
jgi:hypothetical protein